MASIPRTYLTTSKNNINNIPLKNGQVISLYDSDEIYYDAPANGQVDGSPVRRQTSGVIIGTSLPNISDAKSDILYVNTSDNSVSVKVKGAWQIVASSTDTQVTTTASEDKFYLAGSASASTTTGTLLKNSSIYIENDAIHGDVIGNASSATTATSATSATTATSATKDGSNNTIDSTYYANASLSGSTLTLTKGDGTHSTQINLPQFGNFPTSTPGLVGPTSSVVNTDATGLVLSGSGWISRNNISVGSATSATSATTATSATSATNDGSSQNIADTYIKGVSFSSDTFTFTWGDGDTDTISIPSYGVFSTSSDGLVPKPTGADLDKFLKATGEWVSVTGLIPDYSGASAGSAGTHGLVPAAAIGEQEYYLKGDGTWGTTFSTGNTGLVPAPTSSDTSKFLKGDGTWATVSGGSADTNKAGTSNDTSHKLFLVGSQTQSSDSNVGTQTYTNNSFFLENGTLYQSGNEVVDVSSSQALTNKTYEGYTLDDACARDVDTTVTNGSTNLPTSGAVYTHVNSSLTPIRTAISNRATNSMVASGYDSTSSYNIGDYCTQLDENANEVKLYQCITATTGTFDATKWVEVSGLAGRDSTYSLTEKVVGMWVDGSALYERTYSSQTWFGSTATEILDLSSLTYNAICDIEVISTISTSGSATFVFKMSADNCYIDSSSKVMAKQTLQATQGTSTVQSYITIRYTKPAV